MRVPLRGGGRTGWQCSLAGPIWERLYCRNLTRGPTGAAALDQSLRPDLVRIMTRLQLRVRAGITGIQECACTIMEVVMVGDIMVHFDGSPEDEIRLEHAQAIASAGSTHLIGIFTNLHRTSRSPCR